MNLVGKIFTVLIFVMSLVFASFAVIVYATHKNWREIVLRPAEQVGVDKPLGLKWQLDQARGRAQELKDQLGAAEMALTKEKLAHQSNLNKLGLEVKNLKEANAREQQRNTQLTEEKNKATEALAAIEARNGALLTETTDLRDKWRGAVRERDEKHDQLVQRTDLMIQAESELNRLKEKMARVTEQYNGAMKVIQYWGLNPDPDSLSAPALNALVTAVRGNGLVEISVGSDDGVRKGAKLRVVRADGSMYLGQIEVLEVQTDRAVCRIVQGTQQGAINQGDQVRHDLTDVLSRVNN